MKRKTFFSFIILLAIMMFSSSVAEDAVVPYRYGLSFGDDLITAIKSIPHKGEFQKNSYSLFDIEIDGISNCAEVLWFDEEDKLEKAQVVFDLFMTNSEAESERDWYKISASLVKRYGIPIAEDFDGHIACLTDLTIGEIETGEESNRTYPLYEEWLLPHSGNFVKIEHVLSMNKVGNSSSFGHFLHYEVVKEEQLNEIEETNDSTLGIIETANTYPDEILSLAIRNNISFGDTREQVQSKETLNLLSGGKENYLCYGRTILNGIANSEIDYRFDENDTLCEVRHHLGSSETNIHVTTNEYNSIEEMLSSEYGEALPTTGSFYKVVGEGILYPISTINNYIDFGGAGELLKYSERVIDYEGYSLKVDHAMYSTRAVGSDKTYYGHIYSLLVFKNNGSNTDARLLVTAAPVVTPKPVSIPVSITSMKIGRNSIGTTEVYPIFKNTGRKSIDRIDFIVECYDAYGDKILGYGSYTASECYYDSSVIETRGTSNKNIFWTLYGFEGTKSVKIAIERCHFTDGTSTTIPHDQLTWYTYK